MRGGARRAPTPPCPVAGRSSSVPSASVLWSVSVNDLRSPRRRGASETRSREARNRVSGRLVGSARTCSTLGRWTSTRARRRRPSGPRPAAGSRRPPTPSRPAACAPATRATTPTGSTGRSRGRRYLADHGWAGITWPKDSGGRGGTGERAGDLHRGGGEARAERERLRRRHRHGGADDHRPRHGRAAPALPPADAARRRGVVPALQRAGRRQRPRRALHPGRARRRRVGGERPEGVDVGRRTTATSASSSPAPTWTSRSTAGSPTSSSTCTRRASRCARSGR